MKIDFSARVLRWFETGGRKHLPWQHDVTRYRVWVSEIMLQQTQVSTVIPYYLRFMARFPDVVTLANAAEDDVLHHWSGLGYYARARNLHAAARRIRDQHEGRFPGTFDAVHALPGIGRSTAGAILSLADVQRHAILDGNVKRVIARHAGVEGWPGKTAVAEELWRIAEQHLPETQLAQYSQAMMDLGSTVCTRTRPHCETCPVQEDCFARIESRQSDFPGRKMRKMLPERRIDMLLLEYRGRILLEKRPPTGIWGGLWSLPEAEDGDTWLAQRVPDARSIHELDGLVHTFSHFRLHIRPLHVHLAQPPACVTDAETGWYDAASPPQLGLATPVRRILEGVSEKMMNGERDGTHG